MAIKKNIIQIENPKQGEIFAINSHLDEFRFCNLLFDELGIELKIQNSIEIQLVNKQKVFHSFYSYTDTFKKNQFDLIANKTDKGTIIDFLDSIQYFIRISNNINEREIEDFNKQLKQLESVIFVQRIQLASYTNRQKSQLLQLFPMI